MSDQHISPGFITPGTAQKLTRQLAETERSRASREDEVHTIEGDFPAVITSGSGGYHAWTEQAFNNGARYTKPGGRTGTTSVNPACLPDRSTIGAGKLPAEVWLRRTRWDATYGIIYEIIGGSGSSSRFIRFALPSSLATTDASKASCTVDDYWGGPSPGSTVTIYNLPASTDYMFSGATNAKGVAVYDEIDSKWWIIQLECEGGDGAIVIDSTVVVGGDTDGLMYTDGSVVQTASGTRIVSEQIEARLTTDRWLAFSEGSY
jgi:hypothetical protein